MKKIPAQLGWTWIKEGFLLFRSQPAELMTLFLAYMFLVIAIGFIPIVGQLLPMILLPAFSMAFMQASFQVRQGKRVYPNLLFTAFRSPSLTRLLQLGVVYLLAALLALAASALIDDGVFWQVMSGQLAMDSKAVADSDMLPGVLFSALLYIPAGMAFWYAAPLIAWQDMGVFKAIFYSFFSVARAASAFIVYGLGWCAIGILLPAIVSVVIAVLVGKLVAAMILLLPLSIVLTVIMYCSFYPTYTHIFGEPTIVAST